MKTHILRSLELFKGTVLPVLAAESICWPWGPDTWQGAGRALSPFALSAGPLSSGDGPCTGLCRVAFLLYSSLGCNLTIQQIVT